MAAFPARWGLERNELGEILADVGCKFPELGLRKEWTRPVSAQLAAEAPAVTGRDGGGADWPGAHGATSGGGAGRAGQASLKHHRSPPDVLLALFSKVCLGKPVNNPGPAAAKWVTKRPAGRGGESELRVTKGSCGEVPGILQREFPDSAQLNPPGTVYSRLIRVAC